jgi:2-polyprenyl-3-methyl-5-hydroxy-6-metoxy-1,4-benzoquinol methylase
MVVHRLLKSDRSCPYCGANASELIERKYIVIDLRKCLRCGLMFRWPKDSEQSSSVFYQAAYREGLTTDLPDDTSLHAMKQSLFRGTEKDFATKVELLRVFVPTGRILDYGCSWGYGSFQLATAGYDVIGFEISPSRADFARTRLGVRTMSTTRELDSIREAFDAIFASHVLEHLPSLDGTFERFSRLLRPGGLLLVFAPNCGGATARRLGVKWGPMCCQKHSLALDSTFFSRALPDHSFRLVTFSEPYDPVEVARVIAGEELQLHNDGDELVVCAIRN